MLRVACYSVPVYFISGLQYEADKFWIFFALYLLANLISLVVVYTLCFSAPNIAVGNVMAGLVFTVLSMFAGFLIARDKIPDYWIWLHYLDVNMYPIEALLINEVKGMDFHCSNSELVQVRSYCIYIYIYISEYIWICAYILICSNIHSIL